MAQVSSLALRNITTPRHSRTMHQFRVEHAAIDGLSAWLQAAGDHAIMHRSRHMLVQTLQSQKQVFLFPRPSALSILTSMRLSLSLYVSGVIWPRCRCSFSSFKLSVDSLWPLAPLPPQQRSFLKRRAFLTVSPLNEGQGISIQRARFRARRSLQLVTEDVP